MDAHLKTDYSPNQQKLTKSLGDRRMEPWTKRDQDVRFAPECERNLTQQTFFSHLFWLFLLISMHKIQKDLKSGGQLT